jgi:succinate-acetate transporter protein
LNEKFGNPTPLGLMGFGMTTVLLNIYNALPETYTLSAMILSMGIFYGGMAQIFAGLLEFRRGNTFAMTAFCSYGLFWISIVAIWLLPVFGWSPETSPGFMGWYFFMWGLFTFFMWIGSLPKNFMLKVVLFTLFILFWLLAIRDWTDSDIVGYIAGWEGIVCGLSAVYLALAEVINESYGRTVLPI